MRYGGFEWDDRKASSNVRKHGVSFEEATTAFLDDLSVVYGDLVHADRFVLIGASLSSRLLVVVYAERIEAEVIRIITARRATRQEQGHYEEGE
ncbi:MAG TPA: BrnT family toxin [Polyangiaceae bacterium]